MKIWIMLVLLAVSPVVWATGIFAQDVMEEEMDYEYTYGSLVEKTDGQISVSEYDFEKDEEVIVVYLIDGETNFDQVEGLNELQIGDEVDILFEYRGTDRIARMISKIIEEAPELPSEPELMDSDNLETQE